MHLEFVWCLGEGGSTPRIPRVVFRKRRPRFNTVALVFIHGKTTISKLLSWKRAVLARRLRHERLQAILKRGRRHTSNKRCSPSKERVDPAQAVPFPAQQARSRCPRTAGSTTPRHCKGAALPVAPNQCNAFCSKDSRSMPFRTLANPEEGKSEGNHIFVVPLFCAHN